MRRFGLQPVAWQTGLTPVVAMELLAEGAWHAAGVLSAESFDPDPYLAILDRDGCSSHRLLENSGAVPAMEISVDIIRQG